MFKDLVKPHLWVEQAWREALARCTGHENNMKTSLSATLFSLPETTNSVEKKQETRKERVSAPLGRHLLPVQMRRQVKKDYLAPEIGLRFSLFSVLFFHLLFVIFYGSKIFLPKILIVLADGLKNNLIQISLSKLIFKLDLNSFQLSICSEYYIQFTIYHFSIANALQFQ